MRSGELGDYTLIEENYLMATAQFLDSMKSLLHIIIRCAGHRICSLHG